MVRSSHIITLGARRQEAIRGLDGKGIVGDWAKAIVDCGRTVNN